MTLQELLTSENKTKWLDVGSGTSVAPGFVGIGLLDPLEVAEADRDRYHQLDMVNATDGELNSVGQFDLVRSQHMLEHVTFEEASIVIKNFAKLLKPGGYLILSVPDLRIYIRMYLNDEFKDWPTYTGYAHQRVPEGAPNSYYFSYYSHAMPDDPHKWCYDYEGLAHLVHRSGQFESIRELKKDDEFASEPFTHIRPIEDVVLIAQKKP